MKLPSGRPPQRMIDHHDAARYALKQAGGLHRYVVIEAGRVLARAAGMISDRVSKRSRWVRKPR